jgi:mRNA-degrading endonuclease HigB of HigAB toxin-antitoxin module
MVYQPKPISDTFVQKLWKKPKNKNHGLDMNKNTFYLDKKVVINIGHLVSQEVVMLHHKDNIIVQLVLKTLLEELFRKHI